MDATPPLLGLVLLTAIPVVCFALWADYYSRFFQEQLKSGEEKPEAQVEMANIRIATLFGLLAQLSLFLLSREVREAHPFSAHFLFFVAIFSQIRIQRALETKVLRALGKLHSIGAPKAPKWSLVFRIAFWSAFSGVFYLAIFLGIVALSALTAAALRFSPLLQVSALLMGTVIGVISAIGVGFALQPWLSRRMFPSSKLEDPDTLRFVQEAFARAGVPTPSTWVTRQGGAGIANAMVCGLNRFKGALRPTLLISDQVLETLNPMEVQAILLHEASHLKLAHLHKRFIYASGVVLLSAIGAAITLLMIHALFPQDGAKSFAQLIALVFPTFITVRSLYQQSRLHEIEADIEAVKMGASVSDLSSALRKLDQMNGMSSESKSNDVGILTRPGHPATEERILILRAFFKVTEESEKQSVSQSKAA